MKFKKILCFLMSAIILLSGITTFADNAGAEVPYTPGNAAFAGTHFVIDDILDVKRLLDLKKQFFTHSFYMIIEDPELRSLAINCVNNFIDENSDIIEYPEKSYAEVMTDISEDMVKVVIHWDHSLGNEYEIIPRITSMEQLYQEYLTCDKDETYDRVFWLHPDFYSSKDYLNSRLDPLYADFEERYGKDLSKYITDHYYKLVDSTFTHYVYISLSHYSYRERNDVEEYKRYRRIIKNNTILPITEDMTELEKLTVIANSVSNVYHSYMITDISVVSAYGKEYAYSVGLGQCYHYAKLFEELCNLYDIPCIYVTGDLATSDDPRGHAWNMVQYNGNWYHIDLTGQRVKEYDVDIDDLTLVLSSDMDMEGDYTWNREKYYQCTSESIYIVNEFSYTHEITDSCISVAMFEPYRAQDPMTIGPEIYYNILFDTAEGKILEIDTNIESDSLQKVDGQWRSKETVITIPSEINGIKVKSIASYADCKHRLGNVTHLYIPDDIVLEDFAFRGLATNRSTVKNLHIGNNVTIGYDALPNYNRYYIGENVKYMGTYRHGSYVSLPEYAADYFNSYSVGFSEREDITVPDGYTSLTYSVGNNILDKAPTKTLTLNEDIYSVDPRLGRLNRRFVVPEGNPYYTSVDGVLYNKDLTELISVPIGTEELIIPDTVTKIGPRAFEYNNALKSIIFPEDITFFGKKAFHHLSSIERVVFKGDLPDSFEAILCNDFELYTLSDSDTEVIEHRIAYDEIIIENAPSLSGKIYVAFYDSNGLVIEIGFGQRVKINPFAKSYKILVLDDNIAPITLEETGSL